MKSALSKRFGSRRGLVIALVAVVVLLSAVGYVVWNNYEKQRAADQTRAAELKAAAEKSECEKLTDKDICTFIAKWEKDQKYRMTSMNGNDKTVLEIDGKKSHIVSTGRMPYEVITIDKTAYGKVNGEWYKQTVQTADKDLASSYKIYIKVPTKKDKITFTLVSKEACGELQCFKYQINSPDTPSASEVIWFDDKDYKLRKMSVVQSAENTTDVVFDYDNVTIAAPAVSKELAPGEQPAPGVSGPITGPAPAGR